MAANPAHVLPPASTAPLQQTERELAVFDLDGTLTRSDTLLPFLLFACGTLASSPGCRGRCPGYWGWRCDWCRATARRPARAARVSRRHAARRARAGGEAFARERLPGLLRPQAVERLAWHRARGHRLALLTASLDLYVSPWARAAGFDDVLATRAAWDGNGRFAGVAAENCRGEEKVRRLRGGLWRARGAEAARLRR